MECSNLVLLTCVEFGDMCPCFIVQVISLTFCYCLLSHRSPNNIQLLIFDNITYIKQKITIINPDIYGILGECPLISSLPGKALRTLVEWLGLPSDSTCVLEAEPDKLGIKRLETWYSIHQITNLIHYSNLRL